MSIIDRLHGLTGSVAIKAPVRVESTAALTLNALQTVNGVALAAGDRVLVKDQADTEHNGIYLADTGDWTRAPDCNGSRDLVNGTLVLVTRDNSLWRTVGTDPIVVGSSDITFEPSGLAVASNIDISAIAGLTATDVQAALAEIFAAIPTSLETDAIEISDGPNPGVTARWELRDGGAAVTVDGPTESIIQLDPRVDDGAGHARIRLFRSTNTTGDRKFEIFKGDNTNTKLADVSIDDGTGSVIITGIWNFTGTVLHDGIAPPLNRSFESALFAITSGAVQNETHGLVAFPSLVFLEIECITPEHNYVAGDRVMVTPNNTNASTTAATSINYSATNLRVRMSSATNVFTGADKVTGAAVSFTNANWQARIRAWV